jgi:FAD/FMN-containing dehydrogenase
VSAENFSIVQSWGRTKKGRHLVRRCTFVDEAAAELMVKSNRPLLAYGCGRSYGDVCLNEGGRLLVTERLNRFIEADWDRGVIRADAGLTLDELLRVAVPRGWFPFVTPGTKFVTIGGAVANDVHGKNHETVGTFACFVRRIGLARSTGEVATLSRQDNSELFAATIGGLGLTGLITWVEFELQRVASAFMEVETDVIRDLEGFFRRVEESRDWPYTVAWVDCLAKGRHTGRGFFSRARHAPTGDLTIHGDPRLRIPLDAPSGLLNGFTVRAFNALYQSRPWAIGRKVMHYDPFFYPLDAIDQWARLYGRRGFFQHQSVVPMKEAMETTKKLLELTAEQGEGSFLVVLKMFGARRSPGILSFPMPGVTLALDFPNRGESTHRLLQKMSDVVMTAGGRLYPAKDATMSAEAFRSGYPNWRAVEERRDPAIMSDFWRRVTAEAA